MVFLRQTFRSTAKAIEGIRHPAHEPGFQSIDPRLTADLRRWDGGEIALRGVLLYDLGVCAVGSKRWTVGSKESGTRLP
jgi:hypothetical protein